MEASAQGTAELKKELKLGMELYKEPGMMEVQLKAMRAMMMITGTVADEAKSKKAEEIVKGARGVKEVRNRIRVGKTEECAAATDANLMEKLEKEIADDEELTQARRKFEIAIKDRNVTLKGSLKDYSQAASLVNMVRRVPCFNSMNYDELDY